MDSTMPKKKPDWEKITIRALIVLGAVLLFLLIWGLLKGNSSPRTHQQTSSDLINVKEISTLSVSEFVYNGIAQTFKDNGDHDYNVLYRSTVKVSVDADHIQYSIDDEQKTITFVFPEFKVENPVIDLNSIDFVPQQNNLHMDEIIKLCRSDALVEAQKSGKLISSAQDNLKSIMEAWYSPVFEGYTFKYTFATAEGGDAK